MLTILHCIPSYWPILPYEYSNSCREYLSQMYLLLLQRILQADLKPPNQRPRHNNSPKPHLRDNTNLQQPQRNCHKDRRKGNQSNVVEGSLPPLHAAHQLGFRRWPPPRRPETALSYMIVLSLIIIMSRFKTEYESDPLILTAELKLHYKVGFGEAVYLKIHKKR